MLATNQITTTVPLHVTRRTIDDVLPARLADIEIVRWLGAGGMGVVFEGRHVRLDRKVALKLVRSDMRDAPEARVRLLREAWALARVDHPNVIRLFEVGTSGEHPFLVMELAEGGTLRDWLRDPHGWHAILDKFIGFGRGLAAAHALGLVHRDVNPSNVFLDRHGTPKLGDFGLVGAYLATRARELAPLVDANVTSEGTVLGTPAYMPPEQSRGAWLDARADQFAFCVSLHEAVAGELPLERQPTHAVPRPLRALLVRGLAWDPDDRFPSMTALLTAIADARDELPIPLPLDGAA